MKPGDRKTFLPSGIAFPIAFWIIGALAAAQLVAVAWKVVPATIVRATSKSEEPVAVIAALEGASQPQADISSSPSPPPEAVQQAMVFIGDADRSSRVGDWENARESILKARKILTDHPRLELQYAFILERLGREDEASPILANLLERDDLDPDTRTEAARLSDWIEQTLSNMDARGIPRNQTEPAEETRILEGNIGTDTGQPILEAGLQPGATLGIIQAREIDNEGQTKTLRVAIKSRPNTSLDGADVKVIVRFFEQEADGSIVPTETQANSQWISPPVDWVDNEPEILDVIYPPASPDSGREFHGYIVAIYLRDELQDTRAVPGALSQQFPPELFLEPSNPLPATP